jgi:hypothetical protein
MSEKAMVWVISKKSADVTRATIRLLQRYKDLVYAITAGNEKEFAYHEE